MVDSQPTPAVAGAVTVLYYAAEYCRQADFIQEEGQRHLKYLVEAVNRVFSNLISPNSDKLRVKYRRKTLWTIEKQTIKLLHMQ